MHTWHIGCQHFLQVAATAVANHLLRNQYGRHRYLVQRLRLAGSCRDGCRASGADAVHHINKTGRVVECGTVVGVLVQQRLDISLGLRVVVGSDIA